MGLKKGNSEAIEARSGILMSSTNYLRNSIGSRVAAVLLLGLAMFSSGVWAQAGYVHGVSGVVSKMEQGSTKAAPVKAGDKFAAGTVFSTSVGGKVVLKFTDGQVVALSADSTLRVEQFHFDPGSRLQNRSTLEIVKGEMRFLAGIIGASNDQGVSIIAGESMIKILRQGGADFTVKVDPHPQEAGYAVVALGAISVRTPYGEITRIADGQYAPWRPGQTPPPPTPIAAAPAIVQAATAATWDAVLPPTTPIALSAVAQTAAAAAAVSPADTDSSSKRAGYVAAVSSTVTIRGGTSAGGPVAVGSIIEAGNSISTGPGASAVIKFADGQIVVLGASSNLAVGEYRFDPGNPATNRSVLDLENGSMRIVTGSIHASNREREIITAGGTSVEVLSTGSTDFTIAVNAKGAEIGVARVTSGEISVSTPYGPINRIETDKSALWRPKDASDSPLILANTLALVQTAVTLQLTGLPDNTPVAVAEAARAVAAQTQASQAQAAAKASPQNPQLRAEARTATELASLATQAAESANEAVAAKTVAAALENMAPSDQGSATAKSIAAALENLPPAAAGPVLAEAPSSSFVPTAPAVTPGAGGGCVGSRC